MTYNVAVNSVINIESVAMWAQQGVLRSDALHKWFIYTF